MKTLLPTAQDEQLLQSIAPVSRETMERFQIYVDILVDWQAKTNLVAKSTLGAVWQRHICDSVQCRSIIPKATNWLDIGSGAGFPGLVVAIMEIENPDFKMQLVESNAKKCAFLRKVARETGTNVEVTLGRVESVAKQNVQTQVVSARALAPIDQLINLTQGWINQGAVGLFPKGRDYLVELEKCRGVWEFDLVTHDSMIENNSVLLEISDLKKL